MKNTLHTIKWSTINETEDEAHKAVKSNEAHKNFCFAQIPSEA